MRQASQQVQSWHSLAVCVRTFSACDFFRFRYAFCQKGRNHGEKTLCTADPLSCPGAECSCLRRPCALGRPRRLSYAGRQSRPFRRSGGIPYARWKPYPLGRTGRLPYAGRKPCAFGWPGRLSHAGRQPRSLGRPWGIPYARRESYSFGRARRLSDS